MGLTKLEKKVIDWFKKEVREHLGVISDEIRKGNKGDALMIFNEIVRMEIDWSDAMSKPVVLGGSWGRGFKELSGAERTVELARIRHKFVKAAVKKAEGWLQAQGWDK